MAKKLSLKSAEKAKLQITAEQQKEIKKLYSDWANQIGATAEKYKLQGKVFQEKQLKQLQKQLDASATQVANELSGIIQKNIYLMSDAVIDGNKAWLKSLGFPVDGLDAAFSSVQVHTINNLITGQIYNEGWSLSKAIWGDKEQTLKDAYGVVAAGMAQNKSMYEIAKDLEKYVRPEAAKSWNLRDKDGKLIYPKKVDYNAQRLGRTLVQHSYQQTFVSATIKNPFVLSYQWIANGSRRCELCKQRDGEIYKKDELPLDHPNGMCVMLPIVDDDLINKLADWVNSPDGFFPEIDEFAEQFGYKADKLTVSSFNAVFGNSKYKTYSTWFNKLDINAQKIATQLKEESGLGWQKWYDTYIKYGQADKLKKLQDAVDVAKFNMGNFKANTYSGIWKNDVTSYDYPALLKSGSIQKKKAYYEEQMLFYPSKSSKMQAFLNLLEDFEKSGKLYIDLVEQLDKAEKALNDFYKPDKEEKKKSKIYSAVDKIKGLFSPDLYTDSVKSSAKIFSDRYSADKYHRPILDKVWKKLTKKEQYSVWEYTRNSNPINKSLSGYHDSWSRYDFLGLGNTKLNHENSWRTFSTKSFKNSFGVNGNVHYQTVVKDLTTAIEKSQLQDGVYLVRGSDKNGFAGILEGDLFSFEDAKSILNGDILDIKKAFEGQIFQNHAYTSTGVASGTGFSGEVSYEIYAPKGTKAIYAEPASYYGNTISGEQIYKAGSDYYSVGGEAEVILQRGTSFKIVEIEKEYGNLTVKMEIVNQPDYFKSGLEHTHNNGATEYTD